MIVIKTRTGLNMTDNNYYCGFDVRKDLVSNADILDLITLAAISRKLNPEEKEVVNALSIAQCVADPHVWQLKIARCGATRGAFFRGMAATIAYFEDALYGPHETKTTAMLLVDWVKGETDQLLGSSKNQRITGFGVFGRPKDERVLTFKEWLSAAKYRTGRYYRAHEEIIEALPERNENNTLMTAAILLDMGFSVDDMEAMTLFIFFPPLFANALEAAKDQNQEMQNIPGPIEYKGPAKRSSPRQIKANA